MSPSTVTRDAGALRYRRGVAALLAIALGLLGAVAVGAPARADTVYEGVVVDQAGDPVLGIPVGIYELGPTLIGTVYSDEDDGTFSTAALPEGGYFYGIADGSLDKFGQAYAAVEGSFGLEETTFTITVQRYVEVSGAIMNWTPAVGPVDVTLWAFDGTSWSPGTGGTSTDGTFSFTSPIDELTYTLAFYPTDVNTPLLGAFLRGATDPAVDDPEAAVSVTGVAGTPLTGIETYLLDAVTISGTVTTGKGATPLEGIEVWVENEAGSFWTITETDEDGHYTLYVKPGQTYLVGADDPTGTYRSIFYDGWDGCGCLGLYTPVSGPATDIDFDLPEASEPWTDVAVVGILLDDDDETPLYDIEVRLYRASGNGWVRVATMTTYDFAHLYPINFAFSLEAAGDKYRLQFADGDGRILRVVDGGYVPGSEPAEYFDPVPACYASLGTVSVETLAVALVESDTAEGACVELPTPTTPGGSGGESTPRTSPTGVTATPTASPTPTPSVTPTSQPSTGPTPSATPAPEPTPASALDLSWLVWVLLAMVVVVAIGAVLLFVRRG